MCQLIKRLCNLFRMNRIRSHSLIGVLLSKLPRDQEHNICFRRYSFQNLSHLILDILRI